MARKTAVSLDVDRTLDGYVATWNNWFEGGVVWEFEARTFDEVSRAAYAWMKDNSDLYEVVDTE